MNKHSDSECWLYRFHPVTLEDAEEFDTTGLTVEEKEELAALRRSGAKFYWSSWPKHEEFSRCELSNIRFVVEAVGAKLVIQDQPMKIVEL
jgi:hypothetical protein